MTALFDALTVPLAPDAKIVGYVFELDALWFRPKRGVWHLTKPGRLRSWCGREWERGQQTITRSVTWPWQSGSCWSCMDARWSKGVR